jgi:hypothetical protein
MLRWEANDRKEVGITITSYVVRNVGYGAGTPPVTDRSTPERPKKSLMLLGLWERQECYGDQEFIGDPSDGLGRRFRVAGLELADRRARDADALCEVGLAPLPEFPGKPKPTGLEGRFLFCR